MITPNEPDIDQWARQMAGGVPTRDSRVEAVRAAMLAEDSAAREAGAADALGCARLLRRLESEKLLYVEPVESPVKPRGLSLRLSWISAAALLAIVGIGLKLNIHTPKQNSPQSMETGTTRGIAGAVVLRTKDSVALVDDVTQQLSGLGLAPRVLSYEDRTVIEVNVSVEHLAAFRTWAEPRGGRVMEAGFYRVIVLTNP